MFGVRRKKNGEKLEKKRHLSKFEDYVANL
jgi:hypothetical protein